MLVPSYTAPAKVVLDLTVAPELPLDAPDFIDTAHRLEVKDQTSYEIAVQMCQRQAAWEAIVDNSRLGEVRESAHKTWKMILGLMDDCKAAMRVRCSDAPGCKGGAKHGPACTGLDLKIQRYQERLEREQHEEERRILREQAERDRQAREEAARIQREAAEEAAKKKRQGEVREARLMVQEAAIKAEAIIQEAEFELPQNLPATTPRLAGFSTSRPWVAEITDLRDALRSIADHPELFPDEGLGRMREAAQSLLTAWAKQRQSVDLGIKGAVGKRDFGTRISAKTQAIPEDEW